MKLHDQLARHHDVNRRLLLQSYAHLVLALGQCIRTKKVRGFAHLQAYRCSILMHEIWAEFPKQQQILRNVVVERVDTCSGNFAVAQRDQVLVDQTSDLQLTLATDTSSGIPAKLTGRNELVHADSGPLMRIVE